MIKNIQTLAAAGLVATCGSHVAEAETNANCKAYIYLPVGEYVKSIVLEYNGTCTNGEAEGYQTIVAGEAGTFDTALITSYFINGFATGNTKYSSTNELFFIGNLQTDGSFTGIISGPDGLYFDGEIRNTKIYTGIVRKGEIVGENTRYFVRGKLVHQSEYLASQPNEVGQKKFSVLHRGTSSKSNIYA